MECEWQALRGGGPRTIWRDEREARTERRNPGWDGNVKSTVARVLRLCASPEVYTRACGSWAGRGGACAWQLFGNEAEKLCDVVAGLGRRLNEEKALLRSISFGLLARHGARVCRQVGLVTRKGNNNVGVGLAMELGNPLLGLGQGSLHINRQH